MRSWEEEGPKLFTLSILIYALTGIQVWIIAGILHLLVVLTHPIDTLRNISRFGIPLGFTIVITGAVMGIGLGAASATVPRLTPNQATIRKVMRLCATAVGAVQGFALTKPELFAIPTPLELRSQWLAVIFGALLGYILTGIIVIRAAKWRRAHDLRDDFPS